MTITTRIEQVLGIDLRALAVFRILVGGMLLVDIVVRLGTLEAHYSDQGVIPRAAILADLGATWPLSLHLLSGSVIWQAGLMLLAAIAAVALLVGYKTRWATLVSWVLLLGLHIRAPLVLNSGDALLLNLLLWSQFLPLGAHWAIDAHKQVSGKPIVSPYVSVATLGVLLQVCFVYWFTVIFKDDPAWRTDGTALEMALHLDRWVKPLGHAMLHLPHDVLQMLSFGVYYLEWWGPVLAFVPFWIGFFRSLAALSFIGFHLGLALTMALGLFPWVCIAAWVLFLPAPFWDRLAAGPIGQGVDRLFGHFGTALHRDQALTQPLVWWREGMAALLLLYVLSLNLETVGVMGMEYYELIQKHVRPVGDALRIRQKWSMFSPAPPTKGDGWVVVVGMYRDGTTRDLFREAPVSWDRPDPVFVTFKNQRWRKLWENTVAKPHQLAPRMAEYFLSTDPALQEVRIYFIEEVTGEDLTPLPPQKRLLAATTAGDAAKRAKALMK